MIYLYIIMIIYKNIINKTQMILYITIPKEKTMKFLQTNKMKIIYLSISTCMIAIGLGIRYYKRNYKVPLKEYTASCLYIAVMDDEIARLRFEKQVMNGKKVEFPSRIESLQYRYHLHLQLQKGKTRHELNQEISTYEALLKEEIRYKEKEKQA